MTEDPKPLFTRASDDELREAGFDPAWITPHEGEDGPYATYHFFNGICPCCSGKSAGWTVVNIETAAGHSAEWHDAEAETEAHETASMLNSAWLMGRRGALTEGMSP